MKTNLLLTLSLVAMTFLGHAQPYTVGYIDTRSDVTAVGEVGGVLYYSVGNKLYRGDSDHSYTHYYAALIWGSEVKNITDVNGTLYFTENQPEGTALWRDDGQGGIRKLTEFTNTYHRISPLVHVAGTVYFGFADQLYRSDGTPEGTTLVADLQSSADHGLIRLWEVNSRVYVNLRRSDGQYELWVSDGTPGGTTQLGNFAYIDFLNDVGNALYFVADDGTSGRELWRTSPSLERVSDLNPGGGSSFSEGGNVSAVGNGVLVFSTTAPATVRSVTLPEQELADVQASEIAFAGNRFVFISGNDLWSTDGTQPGTMLLKSFDEIRPGHPRLTNLTGLGNSAFFAVDQLQLWQTDGTEAGTILIRDHTPAGNAPSGTMRLTKAGTHLYYFAAFTFNNYVSEVPDIWSYNPDAVWVPSLTLVDAETDQTVRMLENQDVIVATHPFSIRADASLATSRVVFEVNGDVVRRESARPFSLAGDNSGNYNPWNVPPGDYQLKVTPYTAGGNAGFGVVYQLTVADAAEGCGAGTLVREIWTGISGNQVSLIPRNRRPNGTEMLTTFEGPSNSGTNYGARIKGFVCPPATGDYTFWIASNDHSELWLSTDAQPQNKILIANVTAATSPRQWDKFTSQRSAPVRLEAGERYYIEAWHKQGVGTDHVAVGWQLPDGEMERPIPANRLSPFTGNQPPEVFIMSPSDGQVFTAPAEIFIRVDAPDTDGFVSRVELFAGDNLLDEWNQQYEWSTVPAGSYDIWARATDDDGAVVTSKKVNITVTGDCTAAGKITREFWNGVPGSSVSDIPVDDAPSGEMELISFEAPANVGTNYGARVRGFICPPASGDYIFWISSNDHSELWLSTDDDPANKMRIAWITGATNPAQWNKFESQRSAPVPLIQGKRYYVEALHKQGVGTDHLAVGWQLPDGTLQRPIAGSHLSPFGQSTASASYMVLPADGSEDIDPLVMKLEVDPVLGARRYTVELSPDPDFEEVMAINSIEDYQTTFVVRRLRHSTKYYVRVSTDRSGYGPVRTFTTRDPLQNHRLWGITTTGGGDGLGTVFSFSIDSGTLVKHHVQRVREERYGDGEHDVVYYEERLRGTPVAGPDGTLYGQSDHDYAHNVFEMNKAGQLQWLNPFVFVSNGNIMLGSNNNIYVTTAPYLEGGVLSRFPVDNPFEGNALRVFNESGLGWDPSAVVTEASNGYLYGTTEQGGLNDGGVAYRIRHNGSGYEIIHFFNTSHGGMNSVAGLVEVEGYLYGTTAKGGIAGGHGTMFRMRPDGSEFMKLHDFDGLDGRRPEGILLLHERVLYGITTEGGASNAGIIYKVNADGSGFVKLHDFSGVDGAKPVGGLVLGPDDQTLYGMTANGGDNGMGVIFSIGVDGTSFHKLYDLNAWSGGHPEGSLILREDTFGPPSSTAGMIADDEQQTRLSIHPNPSVDYFEVNVSSRAKEKIQLVVTDQYGIQVSAYEILNGVPTQVGREWPRGFYILKLIQGQSVVMKRIVKR